MTRDQLYVACLGGAKLMRLGVSGDATLTDPSTYFSGQYGRLRTVEPSNDGNLWLTTSNPNGSDKDSIPNNSDSRVLKVQLGS